MWLSFSFAHPSALKGEYGPLGRLPLLMKLDVEGLIISYTDTTTVSTNGKKPPFMCHASAAPRDLIFFLPVSCLQP